MHEDKFTVNQVSKLTGLSVRALHYYHQIGLLVPAETNDSGYRYYDSGDLETLQEILLFRELEFPLNDIKEIILSPGFDRDEALDQQIKMLHLQRERIGRLINLAQNLKKKEENIMDFKAFDKKELDAFAAEAKKKWGSTSAYKESVEKTKNYTKDDFVAKNEMLMNCFVEFGKVKDILSPDADEAQRLVADLQQSITDSYYTCTPEILHGLGQMYTYDERFRENIDAAGGSGTAEFVKAAIEVYCLNARQ